MFFIFSLQRFLLFVFSVYNNIINSFNNNTRIYYYCL